VSKTKLFPELTTTPFNSQETKEIEGQFCTFAEKESDSSSQIVSICGLKLTLNDWLLT
jgi:hypothetical protein